MPQFFCYYKREYGKKSISGVIPIVARDYHPTPLPMYVCCPKLKHVYKLIKDKPRFWRTFNQSEMNGESFYYQQIITKKAIYNTTFDKEMEPFVTWKG